MALLNTGSSTAGVANVDANFNLNVNLPPTNTQAGFGRLTYLGNSSNAKDGQISEDGSFLVGESTILLDLNFNSGSATWAPKIGTNATTQTKAVTNGFMRLNSGSSAATTTGISIYTNHIINLFQAQEIRVRFRMKQTNATATNKQMEWGLGYYNFAAGQANAMNEFIGFRITAGGVLQGVLAYSTGGAPTESTVTVNGGTPYTDGTARTYELRISERKIEYWADGTLWNTIAIAADVYALLKANAYPAICRVFNSGAASAAPILDVGTITAYMVGADINYEPALFAAQQDRITHYFQPELLTGAGTNPFNFPASTTVPTAATGSNTASVFNNTANLGGFYRMNGTSFNVATHSNVLIMGYQNPTIPTANGAASNARDLVVTSITVSPQIITTVLAGGPYTAIWFATIGGTALSLATADADGTTAVAQKAHRVIPLSRVTSFAAAAAVGTVESGGGDFTVYFNTPLVVHPGEFICLGQRLISVTAVTSGTIDGACYINGYWI